MATTTADKLVGALTAHPGGTAAELATEAGIGRSTATKLLAALAAEGRVRREQGGREGGKPAADRWTLTPPPAGLSREEKAAESARARAAAKDEDALGEAAWQRASGPAEEAAPADEQRQALLERARALRAGKHTLAEVKNALEGPPELVRDVIRQIQDEDLHASRPADVAALTAARQAGPAPTRTTAAPAPPAGGAPSGRLRPGQLHQLVADHLAAHPGESLSPTTVGKALGRSVGAVANALEALAGKGVVTRTSAKPRQYATTQQQAS
jgi:predicted transcriptional regulator